MSIVLQAYELLTRARDFDVASLRTIANEHVTKLRELGWVVDEPTFDQRCASAIEEFQEEVEAMFPQRGAR